MVHPADHSRMAKNRTRPKAAPGVVVRILSDGRLTFRPWIPAGASGAKRFLRAMPTLEQAVELRSRALKHFERMPAQDVTLAQAIDVAREDMVQREVRPGTLAWFDKETRALKAAFGESCMLTKINKATIAGAIRTWQQAKPRRPSAATILHHRRALSLVMAAAKARAWIMDDPVPMVTWPRARAKEAPCMPPERLRELLVRIRASGKPAAEWDADLILFMAATGLRRSEVARLGTTLRPNGRLWVEGKSGDAELDISPTAADAFLRLAAASGPGAEFLIPGATEQERATRISLVFRKWAGALGETALTAHALRHGFISELARHCTDVRVVQRYARHKTSRMTERYLHGEATAPALLETVGAELLPAQGTGGGRLRRVK